jgi:hypothetical protein
VNEISRTKNGNAYYIAKTSLLNIKGPNRKACKSIFSFYIGTETASALLDRKEASDILKKMKKVLANNRKAA